MLLQTFNQHFFSRLGYYLLVMLVGSWMVLGIADLSKAQTPQTVTWEDLQPEQTVDFYAAFGHLSNEQLQDLTTLARIHGWLEDGQISPESSDAALGNRLEQKLTQQGLDVEQLIQLAYQVQAQANQTTELTGQPIKISGYVLPLNQAEQNQISQLLLVPFVGACIHVPSPPPNQIVYIKPSAPIEIPGLFTRVWVEGTLRQQSASYELFLVDGSRQIQASYAMTLESIAIDSTQPSREQPTFSMPPNQGDSWWQVLQIRGAALFTQQMNLIQQGNSPAALLLGVLVAFGYGVLHTLGPGHGKAVILSYFVGRGGSLQRGIGMGVQIAMFHVISAVGIVVLTDLVIRQTVGSAPANYRLVRLISYGAISFIGGWMLRQALLSPQPHSSALSAQAFDPELLMVSQFSDHVLNQPCLSTSPQDPQNPCRCWSCYGQPEAAGWLSLAVGAVPCSGAILIMLYGLANNMLRPAMLMVLGISLGMAVTLSAIGVAAIMGRNYMSRRVKPTSQSHNSLFRTLNIVGAGGILLVGLLLFLSTLGSGEWLSI